VNDLLLRFRDRWVNPASVRGFAFILAGLFILSFPNTSKNVLVLVLVAALFVMGGADVWSEIRSPSINWRTLGFGILMMVSAVVIAVYGRDTFQAVVRFLAVLIVVRGLLVAIDALRNRRTSPTWVFDITRGLMYIAAGIVVFIIPDSLTSSLLVVGAVSALIIGGILIAFGMGNPGEPVYSPTELGGLVKRWLETRDLEEDLRVDIADSLYFEPPDLVRKEVGFWTLLVLSEVIATLGVLADSTAVVIGAMLVAPLMTPIMGVSAAIVSGWLKRVTTSFLTVVGGVIVAIGVAWIVAVWAPHLVPIASNYQITSRVSPTMLDLMVAIAAGAAGAYTLVDRRVSSSIAGVAIAVALIPPLGVVGVSLQAGMYDDASGAFLLFLTNLVAIILAASIVFLLSGFAQITQLRESRDKVRTFMVTVVLGLLLVMVPLLFTSQDIVTNASRQSVAQETVDTWIGADADLAVLSVKVDGHLVSVTVAGQGSLPSVSDLEGELQTSLGTDVTVKVELFPSQIFTSDATTG